MKLAILGAESTGKTTLAQALHGELSRRYRQVTWVPEALRDWCQRQGRTPQPHEQMAIAQAQAMAVDAAGPGWVLADTTPLMTAVYSDVLFEDPSLYPFALQYHATFGLTLLTDTDLPWVADGMQRDGPRWRERVDTRLRQVLADQGLAYVLIQGYGDARTRRALDAIEHQLVVSSSRSD